jgi:crossover junction endodeoxyribonuclease RuvC
MKILGIDPGVATIGYGVVKKQGRTLESIDYGCIITSSEDDFHKRLNSIYKEVRYLVRKHEPDAVACEEIFFYKNTKTALNVGHARGVILLALSKLGAEIFEYTPLHVKQVITGYGRAEKKEIQEKVKEILSLDEIPKPDDAADALAIALCHLCSRGDMKKAKNRKKVKPKN